MSRRGAAALSGLLFLFGACSAPGEPKATLTRLRREGKAALSARLAGDIFKAREALKSAPGEGVVLGRLVIEGGGADPRLARAQMEILEDGWFAGPVKSFSAPLTFRLNGHEPLDLKLSPPAAGGLLILGDVVLKPLPSDRRAAVRGRLVSAKGGAPRGARVELTIAQGPINTPSGGYSPRGPEGWAKPIVALTDAGGSFSAPGLSPASYVLSATAPGFTTRGANLELKAGQTTDAGVLTLDPEKRARLTYLVAPRPPFAGPPQVEEVAGGSRWRVPGPHWEEFERKWGKGYGYTLEIKQDGQRFLMWSSYFPCRIADLGPGRLEDFRGVDPAKASFGGTQDRPLVPGHVYLFDHETFKYWVLFRSDG